MKQLGMNKLTKHKFKDEAAKEQHEISQDKEETDCELARFKRPQGNLWQ